MDEEQGQEGIAPPVATAEGQRLIVNCKVIVAAITQQDVTQKILPALYLQA